MTGSELDICIEKIASGDMNALEELYSEIKTSVYSFALSLLKNTHDAEDVLQDCIMNIYSGASNYVSGGKPMAWIVTITRNLCLKKINSGKRYQPFQSEDWDRFLNEFDGLGTEEKYILKECLYAISDEERQIIVLHSVSGFKHREIAEMLGMPISTVLSKYNRAIKKIKKHHAEGI